MKFFLSLLLILNSTISHANLIRGQSASGNGNLFERLQVPESQVTKVSDKDYLLETGNTNLLKNPGIESAVLLESWTGAGGVTPALNTTTVAGGKKSATLSFTSLNGVIVHQDVTPTIKMQGRNWEYGAWVSTTTANIQVCAREGGVKVDPCYNVVNDGIGRFYPIIRAGPASGSVGVEIRTSTSTTGSISFDDGYLGLPRNLGSGVPPNEFTASVSETGTVSAETGGDWINGNCVASGTNNYQKICTYTTSFFTSTPNCLISDINPYNPTAAVSGVIVARTASSVTVQTYDNSGAQAGAGFTISCTKAGADFIQPAITPVQWDYDWKDYSQTVVSETGTFPTYTLNLMQHARFAGKLYLKGKLTMTGTNTWSDIRIPVPTGLQILTSVLAPAEIQYLDVGSNFFAGSAISMNASYIRIGSKSGTNGQGLLVTQASPFPWVSGDTVEWFIGPMDVIGWTTSGAAPQLVGSVTSNFNGALRFEYLSVESDCTASPCAISKNSGAFTSATRSATGIYPITWPAGTWSTPPVCVFSANTPESLYGAWPTSTGFTIVTKNSSGTNADGAFGVYCFGPR